MLLKCAVRLGGRGFSLAWRTGLALDSVVPSEALTTVLCERLQTRKACCGSATNSATRQEHRPRHLVQSAPGDLCRLIA